MILRSQPRERIDVPRAELGDGAAILIGALFAGGFIAIHVMRAYARDMTRALSLVAVWLGLFVVLATSADPPEAGTAASDGSRETKG